MEHHLAKGHQVLGTEYLSTVSAKDVFAFRHRIRKVVQAKELMRPSDEPVIFGNSNRLQEATGWRQMIPLEATAKDLLDYW